MSGSSSPNAGGMQQVILALLLGLELVAFSLLGTRFFTVENGFEIVRLNVELGLLALALTPVIVSGGIDLSVGSLMGLSAVIFGELWRDWGFPIWGAALATLAAGACAGGINGWLITRLRIPPLIVTLGSFSLFRGLAEGLTGGTDNYTHFPEGFLSLGQSYLPGGVPAQLPIFALVAVGYWLLLHRTTIGRSWVAIGFSPEGSRHAGIPVERRVALAYVLAGLASSLAALIYVARLGQAKADAGTGYELLAITAVVLGGTSIFGGRGTILGTILGLFAIAVLRNGLQLAALPAELAGILTGALLLGALGLSRIDQQRGIGGAGGRREAIPSAPGHHQQPELDVKNSQVAVLCGVILLAALIVAGGNVYLIGQLRKDLGAAGAPSGPSGPSSKPVTVAMMPKSKGNAYFIACRKGAEEAARQFGIELIWDGPTDPDPAKQTDVIETWITRGVDAIAVAVENRAGISSVLRKARGRGIKVITWDSDADPDSRDFFVNQATPEGIGQALMDNAARVLGGKGEFAIITGSLTAANMIEWQKNIEARRLEKYPDIRMAALRPCDDLQKKAFDEANTIMSAYPNVKLIMAICTPAVPGSAEAVQQSGRTDVKVLGLGLPNDNKRFVHAGITDCVVLWKTDDLGYLAVKAASDLKRGSLKPGDTSIDAGRLGTIEIRGDNILLGKPFVFNEDNIDQFDF